MYVYDVGVGSMMLIMRSVSVVVANRGVLVVGVHVVVHSLIVPLVYLLAYSLVPLVHLTASLLVSSLHALTALSLASSLVDLSAQ